MVKIVWTLIVSFSVGAALADSPRVARRKPLTANVGVVSVGLDTYWKQCPGLLEDMLKKEGVFADKIAAHQVKVTRFGMSDNPQKAHALIPAMKAADLDLLFVDMVTYATSSTFAPFVRELNVPIVLVALQPEIRASTTSTPRSTSSSITTTSARCRSSRASRSAMGVPSRT